MIWVLDKLVKGPNVALSAIILAVSTPFKVQGVSLGIVSFNFTLILLVLLLK